MSSETNIWARDDDPLLGALETDLHDLGSGFLQRVHREVHLALALPPLTHADLAAVYPTVRIAKALEDRDREALLNRAYTVLRDLNARRRAGEAVLVPPDQYDALADGATSRWLAEGRLEDRAEKTVVAQFLVGRMRAAQAQRDDRLLAGVTDDPRAAVLNVQSIVGDRIANRIEYAEKRAAAYVTRLSNDARDRMRQTLYAWEMDGAQNINRLEQTLRDQFATLNRDWRRIALTEASFNRNNGFLASVRPGARVVWSAARDACPFCHKLHGRSFLVVDASMPDDEKDDELHVWVGKTRVGYRNVRDPDTGIYHIEHPAIPLHPHCLPGNARVLARGVSGHSERWYEGPVVTITTRLGNRLTMTPNHPVLTPSGWVAAGLLNVGSHVISGRAGDRMLRGLLHDQHVEGRIEQVIDARRESPQVTTRPVPVAPEHFHGDGIGSKIAHVGTNRELWDRHDATREQQVMQVALVLAIEAALRHPRARARHLRAHGIDVPATAIVRGAYLASALFGRHRSPLDAAGFATPTPSDTRVDKPRGDDAATDTVSAREAVLALSAHVTTDEIVIVERDAFRGHVYNLQTSDGWYVAEGIVTHNCRCTWNVDASPLASLPKQEREQVEARMATATASMRRAIREFRL